MSTLESGVYIHGMFTEGFKWDPESGSMTEQAAGELYTPLPLLSMVPTAHPDPTAASCYHSPVYMTTARRGILSTTVRVPMPRIKARARVCVYEK